MSAPNKGVLFAPFPSGIGSAIRRIGINHGDLAQEKENDDEQKEHAATAV